MTTTSDKPFTALQISVFKEYERAGDYDLDRLAAGQEPTAIVRFKKAHQEFNVKDYLRWKRETEEK